MHALITYLKHARDELKHVVWPSRATAVTHTLVVIAISIATAFLIWLLDLVFTGAVGRFV